jgi:hypothetical protein
MLDLAAVQRHRHFPSSVGQQTGTYTVYVT